MRTSERFQSDLSDLLEDYRKQQGALDLRMEARIDKLKALEEARIEEEHRETAAPIGTRVWCPQYKRHGTVVEARVFVVVENDEYYCDRVGPGQYWVYGTDACDAEGAMWFYTVRTDPSPKVGSVVKFETKVLNIVETEE